MKKILLVIAVSMSVQVFAMESVPYAGQQHREIKALSSNEIDGLENGKGMGLAKAAELNHYPGPRHVLDEAKKLSLSAKQLKQTNILFKNMKQEAVRVGKKILFSEKALDDLFASGEITQLKLQEKINKIGKYRAQLRFIHLKTHLEQKKILSSGQIKHYDILRGYTGGSIKYQNHSGHH